jgi:hypothetical protein
MATARLKINRVLAFHFLGGLLAGVIERQGRQPRAKHECLPLYSAGKARELAIE